MTLVKVSLEPTPYIIIHLLRVTFVVNVFILWCAQINATWPAFDKIENYEASSFKHNMMDCLIFC